MTKKFVSDEEILRELHRQSLEEPLFSDSDLDDSDEEGIGCQEEEKSDHDTDSEQSANEEEADSPEEKEVNFFISKNNNIRWNYNPVRAKSRKCKKDIITHLPGVRPTFTDTHNELDAFSIFITDEVVQIIVDNTNTYIDLISAKYKRAQDCRKTNPEEIKAVIGLLFLAGTFKGAHTNLKDFWNRDGPTIFSLTMSKQRFCFILRNLRFDDKRTRNERVKHDKLAAVRDLITVVNRKFEQVYCPAEYLTIDEQIIPFRGRCAFRQYLPNKPKSYGLKVFAMVDARTFYLTKFEIYAGAQPDGPYKCSNSPHDIVLRLTEPVSNSGRNITTDNWYTGYKLAEALLQRNLTIVGTLRKNKPEIPCQFLPQKGKEINSSMFGFTDKMTIVSFVPKKSKSVILLSTMHHDTAIDESSDCKKPEIITFYNGTKGGVDTNDQLCANYSVGRKTNRWPMAIFYHLLNVSGINAYVCYKHNALRQNKRLKLERRDFLKNLAHALVRSYIISRSQSSVIPRQLKIRINMYLEENGIIILPVAPVTEKPVAKKRKRCQLCPSTKDNKYNIFCGNCENCICKEHTVYICTKCNNNNQSLNQT